VTTQGGGYQVVKGIEASDFSRKRMDATLKELHEERDGVKHLFGK
jgi:malate dehydrogenase